MSALQFIRCLIADLPGYCLVGVAAALTLDVSVAVSLGAGFDSRWLSVAVVFAELAGQAGLVWWLLGIKRVQRWIREGR
jgi:hypothetical protein